MVSTRPGLGSLGLGCWAWVVGPGSQRKIKFMTTDGNLPDWQVKSEAAAFRRLAAHLRERSEVQNIDLMNLAGFCRNCLARWYREAAAEQHVTLDDAAAKHHVYGMDYQDWKDKFQR